MSRRPSSRIQQGGTFERLREAVWLSLVGLVFLLGVAGAPRSMAASNDPSPPDRSETVINTFRVMCTLELPDFEHIDAKATALRMRSEADSKLNAPGDTVFRNKSWIGNLTTGPFVLLLDEMSGPKGKATSCAVAGDVPDLDAFGAETVATMKLSPVPSPEMGSDGSRSFIWNGAFGQGTTLILRDFKPAGKSGIMLKLISAEAPR
jgi:hypothetical protein